MKALRDYTLKDDNALNPIVTDSLEIFRKAGFSESEISFFNERIVGLLDDYAASIGKGAKVKYLIWKSPVNVEIRIQIPGPPFDPFKEGVDAQKRVYDELFSRNPGSGGLRLSYKYRIKINNIAISIPLAEKPKKIFKDPVVWGVVLGLAFGLLLRQLPPEVNSFITNELASPLQVITLNLISGIMGPVIFFSLLSSTIALSGINDLTGLGFKLIRRFLMIILFLIAVSVLVSGLIFMNFGVGGSEFTISHLFSMIFDIIPTNLVDPFLKNSTAQLVILGLLTGAGLLVIGEGVDELKRIIEQINKWIMSIMRIVLLVMPALPFFSITITLAEGKEKALLSGWKFILASYIVFTVCTAIKAVKTSMRSGIPIKELWRMIKPVAKISLTTGSTTAALKSVYEVSDKELRIKPSFSSFWIPMSTAMLSPKTAINVVISAFMAAQLENIPVSIGFLLVLILVTVELSTASPGISAACTAMLTALGLPVSYVGLFTTYRLLTDNYGAACCISYNVLEEVEIAHKLGETQDADNS